MNQNIKDCENYEFIVFKQHMFKNQLEKALDIVKEYIINNKLIITGGMAIDLALKCKGSSLYSDNVLPDYDFYSPNFKDDAYKIGQILCELDIGDVDVINAFHSSTMRVRLNFEPVADITYIPKNLYDKIPIIKYTDGRIIEHPHYKMINMHRSLSYPYENSPYDVILHRFNKDMKRYDILYSHYPITDTKLINWKDVIKIEKNKMINVYIPLSILKEECLCGFVALDYWSKKNKNKSLTIKNNQVMFSSPNLSPLRIDILSDDPISLKDKILKIYNDPNIKIIYRNETLDNIPASINIDIKQKNISITYYIMDNRGHLTSAIQDKSKELKNIYIVNLQFLMQQFLASFFFTENIKDDFKVANIWAYKQSFDLVKEASDSIYDDNNKLIEKYKDFLPTDNVFGKYNINKTDIDRQAGYLSFIGEKKLSKVRSRPFNIYPKLHNKCKIDNKTKNFEINKSWLFNIDGSIRGDLPIGLNERKIE